MTSLKKNFAYNIAYQLLLIILPLITAPYVSRVLGVEKIGTYSYVYSIAYYFGLCGMLGIANHGNRSIALAKKDNKKINIIFSNIYFIQLCTTLIAMVLYLIYVSFYFEGNKIVAYIDTLCIIAYVLDINWLFFGMEQFKLTVCRNMLFKIGTVICTFIFVRYQSDLWKYTLILALGTSMSQAYMWIYARRFVKFVRPNLAEIKVHMKPILTLFIPVIAYSIYKVMDKIMLGSMSSVTQVGLFENSEKIVGIPVGIITAFGTVMMPRISSLIADNKAKQIDIYNKLSFKYFTLIVAGMTFGLVGISNVLPGIYFGREFIECTPLIAGLSFTLIFMTWANIIRTQYLIPNKNDKPYVVATICGAVINFIINITLIPYFQATGALIGTLLAEFIVFMVQMLYVRTRFPILKYLKASVGFFPIGMLMCILVYFVGEKLGDSIKTLLMQVFVGVIVYSMLSCFYLFITKDETMYIVIEKIRNKLNKLCTSNLVLMKVLRKKND